MFRKFIVAIGIFVPTIVSPSSASSQNNCSPELFRSNFSGSSEDHRLVIYLDTISKETYDSAKEKYATNVPGYFDGDFEKFRSKVEKLKRETNYTYSSSYSMNYAISKLDEYGSKAYADCLVNNSSGLISWLEPGAPVESKVTVRVKWKNPAKVDGVQELFISELSGTTNQLPKNRTISPNGEDTYSFDREVGAEFRFLASIKDYPSKLIVIPKSPKFVTENLTRSVSKTGEVIRGGNARWDTTECIVKDDGWENVPNSFSVNPPGQGTGAPRCWGVQATDRSTDRICYNLWISTNPQEECRINYSISGLQTKSISRFENP